VKSENSTISSTASGIAVGQSRRMTSRATGSSDRGRPRKPCFLASKWIWQNTPKKCMKAGTIAARMIVWYGTARYSTIRNAAAPMIGGVICPPVAAAASTAPAKCRA
jgi:hypothetical protein